MKNALFFSFFFFIHISISAQSNWSIGVMGGGDLSNIRYESQDPFDNSRKLAFRLRYGLDLSYRLTDKLTIQSGLRVNGQGNKVKIETLRWGSSYDSSGAFDPTYDVDDVIDGTVVSQYRENFLEIPIRLQYRLGSDKSHWYFVGGVAPNIYLSSWTKQSFNGESTTESGRLVGDSFNKLTLSADIGFGMQRYISDQFAFYVQPTFRYISRLS